MGYFYESEQSQQKGAFPASIRDIGSKAYSSASVSGSSDLVTRFG